jgi:DNA-binding Lrp family transcriptional regulator/hypoxanthine-guanine phosphoribosyltransferase
MTTDTSAKIIEYIKANGQATAKELINHVGLSPQAVFKQLKKLLEKNQVTKIGKPPKVFYHLQEQIGQINESDTELDQAVKETIEKHFLTITNTGERKAGVSGFAYWCDKTGQPFEKTANEYVKTLEKYEAYNKKGLIDGMGKLKNTFGHVYLDQLYYLDFYSIERFGKTKLGTMLLYAKQSQDKKLIRELIDDIEPRIRKLIKDHDIDAIGFIPPTVKREVQFMKELENYSNLNLKKINLVKVKTEIAIPQKTLNKLEDRMENAEKTIIVDDKGRYQNILLVDDAAGSGATLNVTAKQIRERGICSGKIIGLAITGSFKGFDVISEV